MATKKGTPKPSKKAPARPRPTASERRTPTARTAPAPLTSLNYLFVGSNGLYVRSGATGAIRPLTPEEVDAVMPLIEQRRQLGLALTAALSSGAFVLSATAMI